MKFPDPPAAEAKDGAYTVGHSIGTLIGVIVVISVLVLLRAYVISTIWEWYFVPHFGVQHLPMIVAYGMSLLVGFMVPIRRYADSTKASKILEMEFFAPFVVLLMAWIGTFFM